MAYNVDKIGEIRKATEGISDLIDWIVTEVIRGKAIKRIAFIVVILTLCFNPLVASFGFRILFGAPLPNYYAIIFWALTIALIGAAIAIGVITVPHPRPAGYASTSVFRGLIPFTAERQDVALFASLQREREIGEILSAVANPGFGIGYISGESGSGKTSILQAGVAARAESCRTIVVGITESDPVSLIRAALGTLVGSLSGEATLVQLLTKATESSEKPILLVLDQFEQFFVLNTRPQDRRRFIEQLKEWFITRPKIPVKVLISITNDFVDRLVEIQKTVGYTLGPTQLFRVERFSPDQAVAVFESLVEAAKMEWDEAFLRSLVTYTSWRVVTMGLCLL